MAVWPLPGGRETNTTRVAQSRAPTERLGLAVQRAHARACGISHDAAHAPRPQAPGRSARSGTRRPLNACRIRGCCRDARHCQCSFGIEGIMPRTTRRGRGPSAAVTDGLGELAWSESRSASPPLGNPRCLPPLSLQSAISYPLDRRASFQPRSSKISEHTMMAPAADRIEAPGETWRTR